MARVKAHTRRQNGKTVRVRSFTTVRGGRKATRTNAKRAKPPVGDMNDAIAAMISQSRGLPSPYVKVGKVRSPTRKTRGTAAGRRRKLDASRAAYAEAAAWTASPPPRKPRADSGYKKQPYPRGRRR